MKRLLAILLLCSMVLTLLLSAALAGAAWHRKKEAGTIR